MVVYKIQNRVTGRVYIGATIGDLQVRWRVHLSHSRMGKHSPLWDDIRQCGEEQFFIEALKTVDTYKELLIAENEMMTKFSSRDPNTGYNLYRSGGRTSKRVSGKLKLAPKLTPEEKLLRWFATAQPNLKYCRSLSQWATK